MERVGLRNCLLGGYFGKSCQAGIGGNQSSRKTPNAFGISHDFGGHLNRHNKAKTGKVNYLSEELLRCWHPVKNGTLLPSHVSLMSNKKVWWKCDKGHEWQAVIANRSGKNKTGCPYCGGSKATETNNFAALFPHLVPQWNFQRNTKVRPEEVLPYSHLKVWWKCEKGNCPDVR